MQRLRSKNITLIEWLRERKRGVENRGKDRSVDAILRYLLLLLCWCSRLISRTHPPERDAAFLYPNTKPIASSLRMGGIRVEPRAVIPNSVGGRHRACPILGKSGATPTKRGAAAWCILGRGLWTCDSVTRREVPQTQRTHEPTQLGLFWAFCGHGSRLDRLQQISGLHDWGKEREDADTGGEGCLQQHRAAAAASTTGRRERRRGGGRKQDSRAVGKKTTGGSEGAGDRGPHLASPGRRVAKERWEEMAPELDPPEAAGGGPSSIQYA
jgi:hypothetical protein